MRLCSERTPTLMHEEPYYLDRDLKASVTDHEQADPGATVSDLLIGDYRTNFPGDPFYGRIAALRVTKKELSTSEMLYVRENLPAANLTITDDYVVPTEGSKCENLTIDASEKGALSVTGGAAADVVLTVEEYMALRA